ncbi:Uncharacterised protein [Chlamydia abortus]|nr:hypothetical protein [Aneurinibacillus sp. XH2]SHE14604.1 Uncharacterised protein [Chlamydia abortus]
MANQVLIWSCLLWVATIIVNAIPKLETGSQKVLISLFYTGGLGV